MLSSKHYYNCFQWNLNNVILFFVLSSKFYYYFFSNRNLFYKTNIVNILCNKHLLASGLKCSRTVQIVTQILKHYKLCSSQNVFATVREWAHFVLLLISHDHPRFQTPKILHLFKMTNTQRNRAAICFKTSTQMLAWKRKSQIKFKFKVVLTRLFFIILFYLVSRKKKSFITLTFSITGRAVVYQC